MKKTIIYLLVFSAVFAAASLYAASKKVPVDAPPAENVAGGQPPASTAPVLPVAERPKGPSVAGGGGGGGPDAVVAEDLPVLESQPDKKKGKGKGGRDDEPSPASARDEQPAAAVQVYQEASAASVASAAGAAQAELGVMAVMIDDYKKLPFDSLVKITTRSSVERDARVIGRDTEAAQTMSDLLAYFDAKKLLSEPFKPEAASEALRKIEAVEKSIKARGQRPLSIDTLKGCLKNYGIFNGELKKAIGEIIVLDTAKLSAAGSPAIEKMKFAEIWIILISEYMYNYYDFVHYPYLSGIFQDVLKRKQRDPDTDVTDLWKKL